MSESKYGEPWKWAEVLPGDDYYCIERADGESVLSPYSDAPDGDLSIDIDKRYADRIVACVNALAGLNPEALLTLLEIAKIMAKARIVDVLGNVMVLAVQDTLKDAIAEAETPQ